MESWKIETENTEFVQNKMEFEKHVMFVKL